MSIFINSVPQCERVFNPISATPSNKVEGFNPIRDDPQEIPRDISVNLINIGVNKLNKYKFPVRDVIDPNSWSKTFTKEQCIENIVNLSACRLETDTYNFWNLVANFQSCQKMAFK